MDEIVKNIENLTQSLLEKLPDDIRAAPAPAAPAAAAPPPAAAAPPPGAAAPPPAAPAAPPLRLLRPSSGVEAPPVEAVQRSKGGHSCETACLRKQWDSRDTTKRCGCETKTYRTSCGNFGCVEHKWDYCPEDQCKHDGSKGGAANTPDLSLCKLDSKQECLKYDNVCTWTNNTCRVKPGVEEKLSNFNLCGCKESLPGFKCQIGCMGDKRICDWNEEKVGCFDKDLRKLDENALEEYRDRLQNSEKFIKQASRHFDQSLPIKTRLQHVEATLRHIYNNIDSISGSSVVPLVPLQHPADDQPFLNTLISENKKDPEKYANLVGLFKLGVPPKNLKLRAKELFSEIDWDEGLEEKSSFSPKKPPTEEELRAKAMKAEKRRLMAQRKREADEELEQRLINIKVNEKGLENFKLEKYLCNICKSRRYYELNEDACRETCSSEIDNKGDAWFWDNDPYPFSKRRRRRK